MSFDAWKSGYKSLWESMVVVKTAEARKQARDILAVADRYKAVEKQTGVPWFIIGICHIREAGDPPDFRAVLHNGERIVGTGNKTRLVPKGRGPFTTWFEAAVDAVNIEHLNGVQWQDGWGPEHAGFFWEAFNGTGYRGHGIPSPYLWGGTSVQKRGKYVSDGIYDSSVMDPQVGAMAILRELMLLDPSISFSPTPGAQFPKPASQSAQKTAPQPPANVPTTSSPTPQAPLPSGSSPLPNPLAPAPKGLQPKHGILGTVGLAIAGVSHWLTTHWIALTILVLVTGAVGYGLYTLYKNRVPRNLSPKATGPTGEIVELEPTTEPAPVETPVSPIVSEPTEGTLPPVSEPRQPPV